MAPSFFFLKRMNSVLSLATYFRLCCRDTACAGVFYCVLSILTLSLLVLMALFYAANRRDSVSFFRFPSLNSVDVFSCEISLVCRLKYPYSYFSLHFCIVIFVVFLLTLMLVLLRAAVISLSLLYLISSSIPRINTPLQFSMLVGPLPPYIISEM